MSDEELPKGDVQRLPVRYRAPPEGAEPVLRIVPKFNREACNHETMFIDDRMVSATYEVAEGETEVTCSLCQTRLEPMWVLRKLAQAESALRHRMEGWSAAATAARERTRTKCEHCKRMTRIKGLHP